MKTMKRSKLNAKENGALRDMALETIDLRYNWNRRLRNAALALALSDPGWMAWIERNVPKQIEPQKAIRIIEPRARALVLKQYSFFGRQYIGGLIFRDWPFTDDGNLTPG